MEGADRCWEVIELLGFLMYSGADVDAHPELLRDDLVRNVREARALTADEIVAAQRTRSELFRRTAELLERYDVLAFPGAPVVAPPIEVPWVRRDRGRCGWSATSTGSAWRAGSPSTRPSRARAPGRVRADGLPVGLQLVGRNRDELGLLRIGAAIEARPG